MNVKGSGTVTAVNVNATVDVAAFGGKLPGLSYPSWYAPVVGDQVIIDWIGQQPYVAQAFAGAGEYTPASVAQPFATGGYYSSPATGSGTSGPSPATCAAIPFPVAGRLAIDQLGIEVTTAAGAGGVVRLGIYADTGRGAPGKVLLDAGVVPTTTTGLVTVAVSLTLAQGLYWLAAQPEVAAGTLRSVTGSPSSLYGLRASTNGAVLDGYYATTGVTAGALPNPFPLVSQTSNLPKVVVRAA